MAGAGLSGSDPYLQGKPCPKCAYMRTSADTNPAWQCPRCHVAYLKYRPQAAPTAARLVAGGRELAAEARSDASLGVLVAANLLALGIAWATGMRLAELMMVYWLQSVIIGVSTVIRILLLSRFSTEGMRQGGRPMREQDVSKFVVAGFFVVHYGFFHLIYLSVIEGGTVGSHPPDPMGYWLCALVFALNHGYSLMYNVARDAGGRPAIGALMMLPYVRIAPMHLFIYLVGLQYGAPRAGAAAGVVAFFLFGTLKTVADCASHALEHHVYAKGGVLPPEADGAGDQTQR